MTVSRKHIIVVLGMHRCGTSVITKALEVLGVNLGENLLPPQDDNEEGFFEDVDANELNISLLGALGHDWHTLAPFLLDDAIDPSLNHFLQRAETLLRSRLINTNLFGMKDPRVPRLLLFWQKVFNKLELQVSYVIACRNPLSAARSLEKRDGFDLEKGYLLWLEHLLLSIVGTVGTTRVVVDYDRLMDEPVRELRRMASVLGLNFNPNDPPVKVFEQNFLRPSLRHNRYLPIDLERDASVSSDVKTLYGLLSKLADDSLSFDDPRLLCALGKIESRFQENKSLLHYIRVCDVRSADLKQQLIKLESYLAECNAQLAKCNAQLSERDAQLVERDAQLVERDIQLARLNSQIASVLASKSWQLTRPLRFITRKIKF
jgi:hypothetical protein